MVTFCDAGFRQHCSAPTLGTRGGHICRRALVRRVLGALVKVGNARGLRFAALGTLLAVFALPAYAAYADDPTPPPPASVTEVNRSLEQLQAEAAAIQADVAKSTIAYTNALKVAQTAEAAAKKSEAYAASTKGKADIERRKLGLVTAQAYQLGIPTVLGTESMLWSLAPVAENLQEIADRQTAIRQLGNTQVSQYKAATGAETTAGTAAGDAAAKRAEADKANAAAEQLRKEVQSKAASASMAMEGQLADLAGATAAVEAAADHPEPAGSRELAGLPDRARRDQGQGAAGCHDQEPRHAPGRAPALQGRRRSR